jgi:hypothetical protein
MLLRGFTEANWSRGFTDGIALMSRLDKRQFEYADPLLTKLNSRSWPAGALHVPMSKELTVIDCCKFESALQLSLDCRKMPLIFLFFVRSSVSLTALASNAAVSPDEHWLIMLIVHPLITPVIVATYI